MTLLRRRWSTPRDEPVCGRSRQSTRPGDPPRFGQRCVTKRGCGATKVAGLNWRPEACCLRSTDRTIAAASSGSGLGSHQCALGRQVDGTLSTRGPSEMHQSKRTPSRSSTRNATGSTASGVSYRWLTSNNLDCNYTLTPRRCDRINIDRWLLSLPSAKPRAPFTSHSRGCGLLARSPAMYKGRLADERASC